jgi:hypothetical protein
MVDLPILSIIRAKVIVLKGSFVTLEKISSFSLQVFAKSSNSVAVSLEKTATLSSGLIIRSTDEEIKGQIEYTIGSHGTLTRSIKCKKCNYFICSAPR